MSFIIIVCGKPILTIEIIFDVNKEMNLDKSNMIH